jgi:Leucine Rich repeat
MILPDDIQKALLAAKEEAEENHVLRLRNLPMRLSAEIINTHIIPLLEIVNSVALEYTRLDEVALKALAEALKQNTTVHSLNLEGSVIGNEGAKELAETLKLNSTLKSLNLRHNSIGENGAIMLAVALSQNSGITSLNLSDNSIREEGAIAFAKTLERNSTLNSLNLENNLFKEDEEDDEVEQAFEKALKKNRTLTTLGMPFRYTPGQEYLDRNFMELISKSMTKVNPAMDNPVVLHIISDYTGTPIGKTEQRHLAREEELKRQQVSTPAERIVTFIKDLSKEIGDKIKYNKMTEQLQQSMIKRIDDTIKSILAEATASGQGFTHIPAPELGRDATKGDDTEKLRNAINQFEMDLIKAHPGQNKIISDIANKFRRKWNQVIDEYHLSNPVDRVIALIDRVRMQMYNLSTKDEQENIILEINERMDSIREYNKTKQYPFTEDDAKKINEIFETIEKHPRLRNKTEIIAALKNQWKRTQDDSLQYKDGSAPVTMHLPPSPKP